MTKPAPQAEGKKRTPRERIAREWKEHYALYILMILPMAVLIRSIQAFQAKTKKVSKERSESPLAERRSQSPNLQQANNSWKDASWSVQD